MRKMAMGMMTAAALVFAAGLSAQSKPDFTGKWTREGGAGGGAGAMRAGGGGGARGGGGGGGGFAGARGMMNFGAGFNCGAECTITQDASTLKLERMQGGNAVTVTVKLDGSENKSSQTMGEMTIETTSKATWDGAKLVIKSTTNAAGNTIESTTTVWLQDGKLMVETSRPNPQGGDPITTTATYTKG